MVDYDPDERCDLCGCFTQGYESPQCTCDECGMMPDGTCMLAGSEHCEWDCTASCPLTLHNLQE